MAKKKWIQGAHLHKGALHRALRIPEGVTIPVALLRETAKKAGHLGRMARTALNLRGLRHR